ncbi:MAG TPA: hypothetical protein VH912_10710 [Streptosporangiaceae bacterium]
MGIRYGGEVFWVVAWVGLSFAGLVVLAVCAIKLAVAVNGLARELDRTRRRLEPKQQTLQGELRTLQKTREPQTQQHGVRSS